MRGFLLEEIYAEGHEVAIRSRRIIKAVVVRKQLSPYDMTKM